MKFFTNNMWPILIGLVVLFVAWHFYLQASSDTDPIPEENLQDLQDVTEDLEEDPSNIDDITEPIDDSELPEEITQEPIMDTLQAGRAFLEENKSKEGVITTDSGLQYEVLTAVDSGDQPTLQSTVEVHYHGTTIDGAVFDSSVDRGEKISFPLGAVIEGWQEGVQLMKVGEKFKFYIPSELAYGEASPSPAIPANSTLIFEVELFGVQ